jgi:hypothetical protein
MYIHIARMAILLACFALATHSQPVEAAVVAYNGDPNLYSGLHNSYNGDYFPYITEFDDLDITSHVTITDVFTNNFMNYTGVTEAYWEIRSGVSVGNGGTLVAGGFSTATQTAKAFAVPGGNPSFSAYEIRVSNLNVQLTPGKYWLSVAPKGLGPGSGKAAFLYTTVGVNSVGSPGGNNGNAFVFADNPNLDPDTIFANAADFHGGTNVDYSMGLESIPTVPEPASLLTLSGLLGCLLLKRRKRTQSLA